VKAAGALVLVTTSFPILGDGSEAAGSFVSDLAEELAGRVPVRVVAPGRKTGQERWSDRVEVFRYATPDQPLSTLRPWKPADLAAIRQVLRQGERATRQAVQAGSTAHMLALWALPSGYWARRIARETGVPYSVWTLGSDIWTLGRLPLVRGYLRRILRDARACYSDGLKLAEDTARIAGRKVEFLPSTRRIGRTRAAPLKQSPPYRLVFIGRWHPNKGVDLLVEALKLLDEQDWKRIEAVEIFGGGPLEATIRSGFSELKASNRPVVLGGYLDKDASIEAILRSDFLLIPSRVESIPLVFSDAMKLQCPVIAAPVGDLPDLTAQGNGVLASGPESHDFAQAIRSALDTPPQNFQKALQGTARRFSMQDSVAIRIEQLIRTTDHERR